MKRTLSRGENFASSVLIVIMTVIAAVATVLSIALFPFFFALKFGWDMIDRYGEKALQIILLLIIFASFIFLMIVVPQISYEP